MYKTGQMQKKCTFEHLNQHYHILQTKKSFNLTVDRSTCNKVIRIKASKHHEYTVKNSCSYLPAVWSVHFWTKNTD